MRPQGLRFRARAPTCPPPLATPLVIGASGNLLREKELSGELKAQQLVQR